jgi:hypothetical protein
MEPPEVQMLAWLNLPLTAPSAKMVRSVNMMHLVAPFRG